MTDLDQSLAAQQEFEEREREILNEAVPETEAVRPNKRYFRPLPEAEYRSSRVAIEKEVPATEPKDLPKKFMTESKTEAVVSLKSFDMLSCFLLLFDQKFFVQILLEYFSWTWQVFKALKLQ